MPELVTMPGSEFCPSCGLIPDAYTREGKVWRCGECGGKVILSVSSEVING
jgi:ribosomal protein L37AE/L43A